MEQSGWVMRWVNRGCSGRVIAALCLMVAFWVSGSAGALAHNGEPVPPPSPPSAPPIAAKVIRLKPLRWSWLHWWEANRDMYLDALRQGDPLQPPDEKTIGALHDQAATTLIAGLRDAPVVRPEAALALGKVRYLEAFGPLKTTATQDTSDAARSAAIIALGLLDDPQAESFLIQTAYPTPSMHVAGLTALGLMSAPTQANLKGLHDAILQSPPAQATAAAWALEHHSSFADEAFLLSVLTRTDSLWLASATILASGKQGDARMVPLLRDILLARGQVQRLPSWRRIMELADGAESAAIRENNQRANRARDQQNYDKAYERYVDQQRDYYRNSPNPPAPQPKRAPNQRATSGVFIVGVEQIHLARLRASAAIALGSIDHPAATQALIEMLTLPVDDYNILPKGMAIMSLAQRSHPAALEALLEVMGDRRDIGQPDERQILRGYAALALGIYAQPMQTVQGQVDRPGFDQALLRLAQRLAHEHENEEVRVACALALGLARRTDNLRALHTLSQQLGKRDELLGAYTLLARAMVGDRDLLAPCAVLLKPADDRTDTSGILARRAAAMALGLSGDPRGLEVLMNAWHLNHYVNREVAIAMAMLESPHVTRRVIDAFMQSTDPFERAFLAKVIGELLTANRPPRLARLIEGSNYMIRNESRLPYQTMANEFLFAYLIPSSGRTWY